MYRLLIILFLLIKIDLYAEPVDTTEAKQIAINFFQYKNPEKAGVKVKFTKIQIYKGEVTRYTFVMTDNSFVVVSADNSTVPILAYSDEGAYDEIVLENFETEDGADFTAEIVPCPMDCGIYTDYKQTSKSSDNLSDMEWQNSNDKIQIYPNPAGEVLYIEGDFDDSDNEVQIYNLLGDMVVSRHIGGNKATIDLSSLPAGVYVVKVFSDDYRFSYQQKIIKQ